MDAASSRTTITVTRRLSASVDKVFDHFVHPAFASRWLFTSPDSESNHTELDARVEGTWSITDRRGGTDFTANGEYLEVVRPSRLVFTFNMPLLSADVDKIMVDITPDGEEACNLSISQEGLLSAHEVPTRQGWEEMLSTLEHVLAEPPPDHASPSRSSDSRKMA